LNGKHFLNNLEAKEGSNLRTMKNKEKMEKKEVEKELSFLLEKTFKMEDELNSLLKIDD
jgi:hypothetical protein